MPQMHDYDKILTRLTIILQRLYEGELLSVQALAEEFNVSTKTIQRDFNQRLIRFPIEKQGLKWKMQSGHSLTKERTPEEILVIEMLENIAESIGIGFGSKAKTLFSKLQNHTANPIHSRTIIEDLSDKVELFHLLEESIADNRIITFEYSGKHRTLKPYKIVSFEGYWYLYGEEDGKLKTYYFKEIEKFLLSHETFLPEERVYRVLERALNAWFEPNKEPFEVILNASANIAKYFHRRPLSAAQRILETRSDGSIDIAVWATAENEVLHEIKKWMPDLCVISPESLVKKAQTVADLFSARQNSLM